MDYMSLLKRECRLNWINRNLERTVGIINIVLASFEVLDRKSTRLNSSHVSISYAVFCFSYTQTSEISTLSLHDALPIFVNHCRVGDMQSGTALEGVKLQKIINGLYESAEKRVPIKLD